jgi:acetoin utilization protein AcuC
MPEKKSIFIHSPDMGRFPYPPQCPFNTSRAGKARQTVDSMGLLNSSGNIEFAPAPANKETLAKLHTGKYLDALQQAGNGKFDYDMLAMGIGTGDCPAFAGVYDHGLWAAGATITAAHQILAGNAHIAFNPSGGLHHAHSSCASGFCYVNDVVLGCMTLAEAGKKVLYLDIDVHHGDGVQEAFYDRNDVMTISFHQSGQTLFPGTGFIDELGIGPGRGYSVNLPLPIGTYDEIYMDAFRQLVLPLIKAYQPDCLVIEIGTDALADDPLAQLMLSNNVYADIITELLKFNTPLLATGGGGYNFENTVRAWSLVWAAMCQNSDAQQKLRDKPSAPNDKTSQFAAAAVQKAIEMVKENIFPFHKL